MNGRVYVTFRLRSFVRCFLILFRVSLGQTDSFNGGCKGFERVALHTLLIGLSWMGLIAVGNHHQALSNHSQVILSAGPLAKSLSRVRPRVTEHSLHIAAAIWWPMILNGFLAYLPQMEADLTCKLSNDAGYLWTLSSFTENYLNNSQESIAKLHQIWHFLTIISTISINI